MKNDIAIVVPIYKRFVDLNNNEKISWKQCIDILYKYPLILISPHNFDLSNYMEILNDLQIDCKVVTFSSDFFSNIDGYNKLMLSKFFYDSFQDYKYILVHQLDVFVFKDDLDYWMSLGYSYIGAPWFKEYVPESGEPMLWQVGNGGFSLRKVDDFVRVLSTFSVIISWRTILKEYTSQGASFVVKNIHKLFRRLFMGNNTLWIINDYHIHRLVHQEDYFWGIVCRQKFQWFAVPSPEVALKFSFEVFPKMMYNLNKNNLPMGCHGWDKYDIDFWRPFIKKFGHYI